MDLPWEDSLLERKTEGDLRDLLKTMVAFANSVKPGHVAVILIGEKDDGAVQGVKNADHIQKKVREEAEKIYPAIIWRSRVYDNSGQTCVRVEVEYSGDTPHFGGPAWVRRGSETVKASDEVFQRLVDFRNSQARELAKWVGKVVTVERDDLLSVVGCWCDSSPLKTHGMPAIVFVNGFWATFENRAGQQSEPLRKLTLSWDDAEKRLKVLVNFTKA